MPGVVGMAQTLDPFGLGPRGNRQRKDWGRLGVEGMVQTPDLRALGPHGSLELMDWERQGL